MEGAGLGLSPDAILKDLLKQREATLAQQRQRQQQGGSWTPAPGSQRPQPESGSHDTVPLFPLDDENHPPPAEPYEAAGSACPTDLANDSVQLAQAQGLPEVDGCGGAFKPSVHHEMAHGTMQPEVQWVRMHQHHCSVSEARENEIRFPASEVFAKEQMHQGIETVDLTISDDDEDDSKPSSASPPHLMARKRKQQAEDEASVTLLSHTRAPHSQKAQEPGWPPQRARHQQHAPNNEQQKHFHLKQQQQQQVQDSRASLACQLTTALGQRQKRLQPAPDPSPGHGPDVLGGAPLPSPFAQSQVLLQQQQQQGGSSAAGLPPPVPPETSSAESKRALRALVEALSTADAGEREPPRGMLRCTTMPHQRLALGWMSQREEGCLPVGGILADDQGLGKTVTTISLILARPPNRSHLQKQQRQPLPAALAPRQAEGPGSHVVGATEEQQLEAEAEVADLFGQQSSSPEEDEDDGEVEEVELTEALVGGGPRRPEAGTLVVCPTAVLRQWAQELEEKVDTAAGLTVSVYHGKDRLRDAEVLARMGVVLTTYTTMALEAPPKIRQKGGRGAWGGQQDGSGRNRAEEGGPLFRVYWHRVVLDEGHSIKNKGTVVARAAWHLAARNRWLLSGTPLQNSVDDLYSYFRFLRFSPYTDYAAFRRLIKDPIATKPAMGYKRLNAIMKGVMLRRTKSSKIDGKPVVDLPPCRHRLLRRRFSPKEQLAYNQIYSECSNKFRALRNAGDIRSNYVNMLLMLLRLRQACNHPALVSARSGLGLVGSSIHPPTSAELQAAEALDLTLRKELLRAVLDCQTQCPVCEDIPEDAVVSTCKHVYCRTCISTRMTQPEWESRPQCLVCSAPLLHEKDLHRPMTLMQVEGRQVENGSGVQDGSGAPEGAAVTSAKVEQLMEMLKELRDAHGPRQQPEGSSGAPSRASQPRSRILSGRSKRDKQLSAALGCLSRTAAASHAPPPAPPSVQPEPISRPPPGAKMPDKVLVFSQWTAMLDLLEAPLNEAGIEFRRLDGTMSIPQREEAIADFKTRPGVLVLIVSLKAAALGLNLVVANHVVLMDLWWNPTIEQQAIDRAHRIGQTREVSVTRITIEGTVEERILSLQGEKQKMVNSALEDGPQSGAGQEASRLSQRELEYLFLGGE